MWYTGLGFLSYYNCLGNLDLLGLSDTGFLNHSLEKELLKLLLACTKAKIDVHCGLNCVSHNFKCLSPDPHYLRMWLYLKTISLKLWFTQKESFRVGPNPKERKRGCTKGETKQVTCRKGPSEDTASRGENSQKKPNLLTHLDLGLVSPLPPGTVKWEK